MNRQHFDKFCERLPGTSNVIQWGGASVWKVGGKIFAISSTWGKDDTECISFKCSDLSYQILTEQDGIVPAPYLARAKWVQVRGHDTLNDQDVEGYITEAHKIISGKLTKKARAELGL